jgi:hypothetical protein
MKGGWLTYEEAAKRLGITPEAARQRAIRGRWIRTRGGDGKALIQPPDVVRTAPRPRPERLRTASLRAGETMRVIEVLRGVAAAADARLERQAADFAVREAQHAVEMAAERERADKAIAAFAALEQRLARRFTPRAAPSL